MAPSLINPAAAPFFFQAFQAYPEMGLMTVPVQFNPLCDAVEERPLKPETVVPFANTLGIAIAEIAALFAPRQMVATLPGHWSALHSGPRRLFLESSREGKALIFDRGGHLTERLTGHRSGAAIAIHNSGAFARLEMATAISLKHSMRWIPQAYQIKFEACGMEALKTFLGLPETILPLQTGLAIYRRLGMATEPTILDFSNEPWDFSGAYDIEGRTPGDDLVRIRTGFDPTAGLSGDRIETLTVDVLPSDTPSQRLPFCLHPIWAVGRNLASKHGYADPSSDALLDDYRKRTREIHGPPPSLSKKS